MDGKGYAVTGSNSSDQPTNSFYQYDPVADTWATLPSFPGTARSFSIGTTYQGEGYIGFGATLSAYLNDLWKYNPTTDQWSQLASCPCSGRRHPAMIARQGKLYIGLGDGAAGNLRDWWVYDMTTNSWSALPDLPGFSRHHPFQFVAGNQVFAGMGHGGNIIFDDWYKLDTVTDQWVILNDFPGEARVAGTQFDFEGMGYVLSGDGDNHSFMASGEMWQYDYNNDSWTQMISHPGVSRWAPGSFVIGNDVFFFGGVNRLGQFSPVTAYKFPLKSSGIGLTEYSENRVEVYPNPTRGEIFWKSDKSIDEVRVLNGLGQEMKAKIGSNQSADLSGLGQGIYILNLYHKGELLQTSRILIGN